MERITSGCGITGMTAEPITPTTLHLLTDAITPTAEIISPTSDSWLDPITQTVTASVSDDEAASATSIFTGTMVLVGNSLAEGLDPGRWVALRFRYQRHDRADGADAFYIYAYDWAGNRLAHRLLEPGHRPHPAHRHADAYPTYGDAPFPRFPRQLVEQLRQPLRHRQLRCAVSRRRCRRVDRSSSSAPRKPTPASWVRMITPTTSAPAPVTTPATWALIPPTRSPTPSISARPPPTPTRRTALSAAPAGSRPTATRRFTISTPRRTRIGSSSRPRLVSPTLLPRRTPATTPTRCWSSTTPTAVRYWPRTTTAPARWPSSCLDWQAPSDGTYYAKDLPLGRARLRLHHRVWPLYRQRARAIVGAG